VDSGVNLSLPRPTGIEVPLSILEYAANLHAGIIDVVSWRCIVFVAQWRRIIFVAQW
jgi:hypothetical protein